MNTENLIYGKNIMNTENLISTWQKNIYMYVLQKYNEYSHNNEMEE
jgi:hypothetical protein